MLRFAYKRCDGKVPEVGKLDDAFTWRAALVVWYAVYDRGAR
jgi:hypothetical protein